ncbi:hypothetical protein DFQ28_011460 [Apophysomyces sp. BC1034]|nr:hypothetical protein DFQ30_011297 [Apophysomyces sp. BC1015]KAG0169088.1 hypothetical protein DFQ29_009892 [Apophysomyces sp. BC1021]KAG0184291.1 hypothetical protein DFQ28_011460 [Apophysomyces sp. BC1034]
MPLFGFRKAKRFSDKALRLRKTKSTGSMPTASDQEPQTLYAPVIKTESTTTTTASSSTSNSSQTMSRRSSSSSGTSNEEHSNNNNHHQNQPQQQQQQQQQLQDSRKPSLPTTRTSAPAIPTIQKTSSSTPSTPTEASSNNKDALVSKVNSINVGDLELLLSMETQARMDAQEERERNEAAARESAFLTPRPSRLKFALPVTPPRSRSPAAVPYPRARPTSISTADDGSGNARLRNKKKSGRRSRWSRIMSSDPDDDDNDSTDDEEQSTTQKKPLFLGAKVKLIRRPLPTMGYVRYLGPVDFGQGSQEVHVGIELEHRVGNNDGSINGKRYFQTDPHRGIFVKQDECAMV